VTTLVQQPLDTLSAVRADGRPEFFEQPVPRRFVHRQAVSEVLLTGFAADGEDRFLVAAQLPRGHSFYRSHGGRHDPILLAETIRQTGLMIGHAGYGVPFGHAFIMDRLSYRIDAEGLRCGSAPAELVLAVTCHDVRRRGSRPASLSFTVELHRGLERIGTGTGSLTCLSPAVYARIRGLGGYHAPSPDGPAALDGAASPAALPTAVRPESVGRTSVEDVVLAELPGGPEGSWLLRADQSHPVLFDHPVDHLPGMVLVEAMRQALYARTGPVGPTELDVSFHAYAALDVPTVVRVLPAGPGPGSAGALRVVVEQDDALVAEGLLGRGPELSCALTRAAGRRPGSVAAARDAA